MLSLQANPTIYRGYIHGMNLPAINCALKFQGACSESSEDLAREFLASSWQDVSGDFPNPDLKILVSIFLSLCKKLRVPTSEPLIQCQTEQLFNVLVPYVYLKPTVLIVQLALNLFSDIEGLNTSQQDVVEHKNRLINKLETSYQKIRLSVDPSLNNYYILEAAIRAGIPHKPVAKSAWRLGYGKYARIFESTMTDQTPAWSVKTAKNKKLTADYLRSLGLPGAQHVMVQSEAQLLQAIQKIKFPLVVKPLDAEQGNGVSADLMSEEDALIAFKTARKYSKNILVEKHQSGFTHRVTLLNHRVIKVVKRVAGGVVGDGKSTIFELINLHQKTTEYQRKIERRGKGLLDLDDEALSLLKQYHLTPQTIPDFGQYIRLRRRDNINAGGRNESIPLHSIHSDNLQLAMDVSKHLHFDIVGIDLIIDDIGQSWLDIGATICEINAQPQLGASQDPELYPMLLKELLVEQGLIPVDLVIKTVANQTDINLHNAVFKDAILTDRSGIYRQGQLLTQSFENDFLAARAGLAWKSAQEVVCHVSYEELLKHGLPVYHQHIRCVYHPKDFTQMTELARLFDLSSNQFKSL